MNVTVTEPTADSFVTVYPDDVPTADASNLNFATRPDDPEPGHRPRAGEWDRRLLQPVRHDAPPRRCRRLLRRRQDHRSGTVSSPSHRSAGLDTRVSSPFPAPGKVPGGHALWSASPASRAPRFWDRQHGDQRDGDRTRPLQLHHRLPTPTGPATRLQPELRRRPNTSPTSSSPRSRPGRPHLPTHKRPDGSATTTSSATRTSSSTSSATSPTRTSPPVTPGPPKQATPTEAILEPAP